MRWLVTGSTGMLGQAVVAHLRSCDQVVSAADRGSFDHVDLQQARDAVRGHDVVVNCAAWTDVDGAETREADALRVNAVIPEVLARGVAAEGARMVHVSTDYVFDGAQREPYAEDAPTSPISAYGRTKAAGELAVRRELPDAHLLVRSAWLYGEHGGCFPRTIVRQLRERGQVAVVSDQVGQPTWTRDVADFILRMVQTRVPAGTYHATASGSTSWFEFAREVAVSAGMDPDRVAPTSTGAFPRAAARPANSVLGHAALHRHGIRPIGDWRARWAQAAPTVLAAELEG